ncbi:AzlC family ABC transporter permease [Halorarius litoreus]|uniref:AzlC family ABC transporter permease n=1 Tax=Halorarius litoreus TaxID=2962676 RepID=UPI0020CBA592|nr:AzlC family ABC transporter permease [Halorarius litoreus]
MTRRGDFLEGARTVVPVLVGVVPFGLVAGAAAVNAGLSPAQAVGLSVIVFAGAAQLAAIELLGGGSPLPIVVAIILVINLRMTMYSASIAPHFEGVTARVRSLVAYVLTDQTYALSVTRFRGSAVSEVAFFLGAALPLWVVWQVCTVVGLVLGANVPDWLPLEFGVPLTFLALLVPNLEDAATGTAAIVGGVVATLAVGVPFELGLLVGAMSGLVAGFTVEEVGA